MDSTVPVNWEALDSLIINFAKSENLLEEESITSSSSSSPPSSPSSSSYRSRLVIRQIRRLLEIGDIDSAIDLLRIHATFVLDDHRLLFRLQKQKFIELLRKGTVKDRDSAIECLRTALAPCALDAYPEAYEEFKHVLLAFIFDKDDETSPVANEWSEKRRFDLAGLLSSVLRVHLHAFDPIFSMTLRYLISIHKGFCFRQGIPSPISNLTERLLLEERDLAPTPQESLLEAPPFDEVDVQALAHAVDLTRQGAIDSLRFAKGDLFQAFKNELCRMKLDVAVLDELVQEYCIYRGIVDGGFPSSYATDKQSLGRTPDPSNGSVVDCSVDMDCLPSKDSDGETSVTSVSIPGMDGPQEIEMQGTNVQQRSPYEMESNREDCSTSFPENFRRFHRTRGHGTGERSGRKRWRGRVEELEVTPAICPSGDGNSGYSSYAEVAESYKLSEEQAPLKRPASEVAKAEGYKYDIVLEMKELTRKGMAAEVVEEINAMDPSFFPKNPVLLFQLKQVEFLKLVKSGDHSGALKVASSYLGPSAASNPTLLKPLKETLLALLSPNGDASAKGIPLSILATSLQVALGRRLGIEEPQLMKIVRETLHTHNEWFKLQMCKDRFEGLLKIDSLKEINCPIVIDGTSNTNADTDTPGSSQVTISSSSRMAEDSSSPTQVSSRDVLSDENAILKVMEFLALPRADAIHLLAQYNGNAETVIQQLFA